MMEVIRVWRFYSSLSISREETRREPSFPGQGTTTVTFEPKVTDMTNTRVNDNPGAFEWIICVIMMFEV